MLINAASSTAMSTRNVLLDEALEPKLVDFGFSVITNLIRNTLKAGHGGNGFNPYAAPERNADKRVGIGADIYSLGIVLYELRLDGLLSKQVTTCKTSTTNPAQQNTHRFADVVPMYRACWR